MFSSMLSSGELIFVMYDQAVPVDCIHVFGLGSQALALLHVQLRAPRLSPGLVLLVP
jgi:hypothetical protein